MATVSSTLANQPLFLQAVPPDAEIEYTATQMRLLTGAVFPRTGGVGGTAFRIMPRVAGANFSVDIMPGFAVAGSTSASVYDRYLAYLPTRTNIPLTGFNTAPAATRTHRVFLGIYDKQVLGTEYAGKLIVTEDTGSGAPLPADNPAYTLELGTFTIAPSQANVGSADITNSGRKADLGEAAIALPMNAGFVSGGTPGGPTMYALTGNTVKLSGTVNRTPAADFAASTYSIATLPSGYRPRYQRYVAGVGESGNPYRLTINTTGIIQATLPTGTPDLLFIALDGCQFEID